MKEIWVVWIVDDAYEFFSTEEKARKRCIDIIVDTMADDRYEMAECLLELAEYDSVTDVCGFYSDVIDPYDNEEEIEIKKERSPRGMKYHIYNRIHDHEPLTAEGHALEFDTEEAALRFILSVKENTNFELLGAYVVEDILYYDGGYIDATNLIINKDGDLEEVE